MYLRMDKIIVVSRKIVIIIEERIITVVILIMKIIVIGIESKTNIRMVVWFISISFFLS